MFNALGSASPGASWTSPSGLTGERVGEGRFDVEGDSLMLSRLGGGILVASKDDRLKYGLLSPGTPCPGERV